MSEESGDALPADRKFSAGAREMSECLSSHIFRLSAT